MRLLKSVTVNRFYLTDFGQKNKESTEKERIGSGGNAKKLKGEPLLKQKNSKKVP